MWQELHLNRYILTNLTLQKTCIFKTYMEEHNIHKYDVRKQYSIKSTGHQCRVCRCRCIYNEIPF
jgi:hypothetical protein